MKKEYPLIIVFYLDVEMMKIRKIIEPFVEAINHMLEVKNANALAFFIPTSSEERVECINPVVMKDTDMEKINQIVEDIKANFSVGVDMDVKGADILIDAPENNECTCNGGKCNCDK